VNHPRLVILDELTQGLDPSARRGVWAAIEQLRAGGATVLLVTHELDEAEQLCDRVYAMRGGQILDRGSPAELVDRHGRSTTITFSPTGQAQVQREAWSARLGALPGVDGVSVSEHRVTVRGDRRAIAYVGAALAENGPVPADLSVRVPSLDDALVGLLARAEPKGVLI
jgi:ABC-2 type transport system ATP-binding protein